MRAHGSQRDTVAEEWMRYACERGFLLIGRHPAKHPSRPNIFGKEYFFETTTIPPRHSASADGFPGPWVSRHADSIDSRVVRGQAYILNSPEAAGRQNATDSRRLGALRSKFDNG